MPVRGDAEMTVRMAGLGQDAGVVAAIGQHEGGIGIGQVMELVDRAPRRDVIQFGADREDRHPDVVDADRAAIDLEAALREVVVQEQLPQIFRVHAVGHARGIGVPGHDVDRGRALAHQVFAHEARPDQVVRSQQLERAGHLPGVEITALPHHVFKEGDLAFVDEEPQLAGLAEVGLRGEEAHAGETVVVIARHGGGCDRQQRAAETVADCMHLLRSGDGSGRVNGGKHALQPVVVEPGVAILATGILPRHHEHREALLGEVLHQRIHRR